MFIQGWGGFSSVSECFCFEMWWKDSTIKRKFHTKKVKTPSEFRLLKPHTDFALAKFLYIFLHSMWAVDSATENLTLQIFRKGSLRPVWADEMITASRTVMYQYVGTWQLFQDKAQQKWLIPLGLFKDVLRCNSECLYFSSRLCELWQPCVVTGSHPVNEWFPDWYEEAEGAAEALKEWQQALLKVLRHCRLS